MPWNPNTFDAVSDGLRNAAQAGSSFRLNGSQRPQTMAMAGAKCSAAAGDSSGSSLP